MKVYISMQDNVHSAMEEAQVGQTALKEGRPPTEDANDIHSSFSLT